MMFLFAGHSAGLLSKNFVKQRLHENFRIPAPWLTKEIIFVCTVFLSFTLWMTCERTLIFAQSTLWIAPQNLQFTLWNSRLWKNRCQLLFFFTQLFVYGLCVIIWRIFLYDVIDLSDPGYRFFQHICCFFYRAAFFIFFNYYFYDF